MIFARISNLNHFSFNWTIFAYFHYTVVVDKNYIYMCRCLFIFMKQNLKWFFQSVSIKLLDSFFRSIHCSLNLIQALSKQLTGTEFISRFRLQLFIDFFKPELNQIHAFTTEHLFSTISWYLFYYWYFKYITSIVTYSRIFAGSWIVADVHKKIQLEDWRVVYVFLHPDISRKFAGLEDGFGSIIEQLVCTHTQNLTGVIFLY